MRVWTRTLLVLSLFSSLTVFAAKIQEFKETPGHTQEEIEQMKRNSKIHFSDWQGDASQETTPFPWMAAGLAVIVLLVALPFAVNVYRRTSDEINEGKAVSVATDDQEQEG